MYRNLLVPLDGSAFAEQALPLALQIAGRTGATLRLVRVHVLYAFQDPACSWVPFDAEADRLCKQQEQSYLDGVVQRLAGMSSVPVTSAVVLGLTADGILEEARAQKADLIVMTTHGRGPLNRFWLGGVADEVVRRAPVPVLLVPSREAAPAPAGEPALHHMLITLDGSALAEQVLPPALALGQPLGLRYTLLQAVEPVLFRGYSPAGPNQGWTDQPLLERRQSAVQDYLEQVARRLGAPSVPIQTRVVAGHAAAVAILEEARIAAADLIALATHGRGGLKRLLLGSVADKVVRGSQTPVLIHRPQSG
jgi:nucleotide-binding universal stress UspA family protein